jgi:hypothetical protein
VLAPASVTKLFAPRVRIEEGAAGLGWFRSSTASGIRRIFTRGNDDWGPNSLLYAYPDSDVVIVVLSHAGDTRSAESFSRAIHRALEQSLFQ